MKLNNIPLELDNRISDIADIKTVITADENAVGKMGYFANSIHLFKNLKGLDGIKYGKLIYLSDLDYGGDKSDKCFVCSNQWAYRYFIPEDALKPEEPEEPEKKYRAFTIKEFQQKYSVGSVLKIRQKQNRFTESVVQYVGYKKYEERIYLGITDFILDELFENFEMIEPQSDTWHPFGVIDEDKE